MPASMRIEIFPSNFERFVGFYVGVLGFKLLRNEPTYVYVNRDDIFVGAIEVPNHDSLAEKRAYRAPHKGIEIVFEVDDLVAERDRVVSNGWKLDHDIQLQPWGLEDLRVVDPDGYYIRITTCSPNRLSQGKLKA